MYLDIMDPYLDSFVHSNMDPVLSHVTNMMLDTHKKNFIEMRVLWSQMWIDYLIQRFLYNQFLLDMVTW